MKFIKKFNESKFYSSLEEFCKDYLVHLLDDGYELKVQTAEDANMLSGEYLIIFSITPIEEEDLYIRYDEFKWLEIKDTFIPFVTMLNESYNIDEIYFYIKEAPQNFTVNINSLISDEIDNVTEDAGDYYDDLPKQLSECNIHKIEIILI